MKKINLNKHEKYLKENIFFTKNRWPHFNLIFKDIKKLEKLLDSKSTVISLERNSLYGGISLFSPFFSKKKFISVDCSTSKIRKRGEYNKIKNKSKMIVKKNNYSFNFDNIKLNKNKANLILIPNLMHHIPNLYVFFNQVKKLLKKKGTLYIFEPLIRELHQIPEDYFRVTPYGYRELLKAHGFDNFKIKFEGGPFTAIGYCWDQAIQYLPKKEMKIKQKWLNKQMSNFKKLDKKYRKNNYRKDTSFPMSFSIMAQKK